MKEIVFTVMTFAIMYLGTILSRALNRWRWRWPF